MSLAVRGGAARLRESVPEDGLDVLGFPWILSCETRDFNGLNRLTARKILRLASFAGQRRAETIAQGATRPNRSCFA
jgi:hypothetical protein